MYIILSEFVGESMIRELRKEDIKECLEIYNYYIENTCFTLEEEKLSLSQFEERCLKISNRFPYIVAINDDGKILGYAYLDIFHERSAYKKTVDLSIYVDKNHLHEHIGQLLLNEIIKLGKERCFTNIISIVTSENQNSLNFHLKNGFILEGTLKNIAYKLGKNISTYYLRKFIG